MQKTRACHWCKCLVSAWVVLDKTKSWGHFWKHRKSIQMTRHSAPWLPGESDTIHDPENTKNWKLNMEAVTKMDNCLTRFQYKTGEFKWDIYSYFVRGLTSLLRNKHAFPIYKMAFFQTCNKNHEIENVLIWVDILQLGRYAIPVITWLYLKAKMRIFKALTK